MRQALVQLSRLCHSVRQATGGTDCLDALGLPVVPISLFGGEGSPTKIATEKRVPLILTSLLENLVQGLVKGRISLPCALCNQP